MKIIRRNHGLVVSLASGVSLTLDWTARQRRQLHERGIWVTKDLQEIHVSRMSDTHLLHTLRFLERRALELSRRALVVQLAGVTMLGYPEPQGEMAQDAYWQGMEEHCDETYERGWNALALGLLAEQPIFKHLVHEAMERDLHPVICGTRLPNRSDR